METANRAFPPKGRRFAATRIVSEKQNLQKLLLRRRCAPFCFHPASECLPWDAFFSVAHTWRGWPRRLRVSLCSLRASGFGLPGVRARSVRPVVVGYFPQWGLYYQQPYLVKTLVANGSASHLDQLNYAQGFVNGGHCSLADPNADLNASFKPPAAWMESATKRLLVSRILSSTRRIEEAVSAPEDSDLAGRQGERFRFDAQPENRQAFVASCVDLFIRGELRARSGSAGRVRRLRCRLGIAAGRGRRQLSGAAGGIPPAR